MTLSKVNFVTDFYIIIYNLIEYYCSKLLGQLSFAFIQQRCNWSKV